MRKDIKYKDKLYSVSNYGKILRFDRNHYVDQLSENNSSVFTRSLDKYFSRVYNLSKEEYFNIVMLEGNAPKCSKCGSSAKFLNLNQGHSDICPNCGETINLGYKLHESGKCRSCGVELSEFNSDDEKTCLKCSGMNYDKSSKFTEEINGFTVYYPGILAKRSFSQYLDQLDGVTLIRGTRKFTRYIEEKYHLKDFEYYNLVVLKDINYISHCQNEGCNNLTNFIDINHGYKDYCCNSCGYESRGDLSRNFKSYYDRLNETVVIRSNKRKKDFTKMTINEIIALMYHGYRCYSGKYSSKYSKCYLYYAEFDNDNSIFKIGISVNPKDRWCKAKYKNPVVLLEGSVEDISKTEFTIKKNFVNKLVLESEYPTEIFRMNDHDDIIRFINEIKI